MRARGITLLLAAALTTLTVIALAGHGPRAGEVIWAFDDQHGLNRGDLLPLGVWAVGIAACVALWRGTGS